MLPEGKLLGLVRNITERKRAENVQREREQHLRLLSENMVDAISQINSERVIVYCSPSVERVFGFKLQDLLGRSAYEKVHPEDVDGVRQQALEAIATQRATLRVEYRYLHARGEYVLVESIIRMLFDANGQFAGYPQFAGYHRKEARRASSPGK